MAPPFNLTNVANSTDIVGLIQSVNTDMTGDMLGIIIIVTIYLIFMISFKGFETQKAFIAATGIATIMALLMFTLGLIPEYVLYIFIILLGLVGTILVFRNSR